MIKHLLLVISFFYLTNTYAQLGFCSGSKGDPIFQEDFTQAGNSNSPLEAGITTYRFVRQDPEDGEYTISNDIGNRITTWHSFLPQTTVSGGQALIVNADFTYGQFYRTDINGLCEKTTYEFSAYLMNIYDRSSNICPNGGIPNNVRFEIWDETDSVLLRSGDTGNIPSTTSPQWEQYALTFQSEPGQNSVILKMFNNGDGGCGNDLAIDDIIFRSCGDLTSIASEEGEENGLVICPQEVPYDLQLNASSDSSVYDEIYYQWQQSLDEENWQNISGENSEALDLSRLTETTYFRVKIAENQSNLASNLCSSASEAYLVKILQALQKPVSLGDQILCQGSEIPFLEVQQQEGVLVNWYDADNNLLAESSARFLPETEGIYYAEANLEEGNCAPSERTAITFKIIELPEIENVQDYICPDAMLTLEAGITGRQYLWNTGATSAAIDISAPGTYELTITTTEGCELQKTFEILETPQPEIEGIAINNGSVTIVSSVEGDFQYSLDGLNYQDSNIFLNISGGNYTAFMQDTQACKTISRDFSITVIPKFFTPNADGYNDVFRIEGDESSSSGMLHVFDKYGKLLKSARVSEFSWNGDFNGQRMPSDDYWYSLELIDGTKQTGHFSLIRGN